MSGSDCCEMFGMGNVDSSPDLMVTMSDLTVLIDHLFVSFGALDCWETGNVDLSVDGLVTMSDLTVLIDYLFVSFMPLPDCPVDCPSTVIDFDGNVYETVLIGNQCWMVENLRVTHYRNGEAVPNVTDGSVWDTLSSAAYCNYNNGQDGVLVHGRLYNGFAVNDSRGIAPEGWHIPTDGEWRRLEMHLGMSLEESAGFGFRGTNEGGKLKEAGVEHWRSPNTGATNESGFFALPSGCRGTQGSYLYAGMHGAYWSSTPISVSNAYYRELNYADSRIKRSHIHMTIGFSVRCVRD